MFKIIYTSDLHGNKSMYERLVKRASEKDIDAVVIGGDLCPRGGSTLKETVSIQRDFLEKFMIPLFSRLDKDVFLIMGNDDFMVNEKVLKNSRDKNPKYVHKKSVKIRSEEH